MAVIKGEALRSDINKIERKFIGIYMLNGLKSDLIDDAYASIKNIKEFSRNVDELRMEDSDRNQYLYLISSINNMLNGKIPKIKLSTKDMNSLAILRSKLDDVGSIMPGQLYFNVINDENSLTHATDDEDAAEIKSRLKMEIQRISGPISRIEKASETVMTLQGELNRISSGLRQVQEGRAEEKALYWERLAVVESLVATLQEHEEAAKAVLEKADEAFTAATRQGLAKAFSDQEKKQSEALGTWVAVLLGALTVGGVLGAYHFKEVREILANKDLSDLRVVLYLLMSALFLVGPGWFAWLATKQIGQRFRLAQDYAFKAAAASAYRGYRTEAQEIDAKAGNNELEQRLMASVLSRFDEQPLRLIEETAHGSPWHDLLSSQGGKELLARASDAVGKIPDIMKDVLAKEPKEKP